MTDPEVVVIGFGNPDRQDDAAGLLTMREVQDRLPVNAAAVEGGGDVLEALNCWPNVSRIILIDAVRTGAPVGTVHVWRGETMPGCVRDLRASTHGLSILELVRLARVLHDRNPEVVLIGIEAAEFVPGRVMSDDMAQAIARAACLVQEEVGKCTSTV